MNAQASNETQRELKEAVGNLAGVVAFTAFDIGDQELAGANFEFALWCAEQGGSWQLRATTLADMARQAVYLGDLATALSQIEFAQVRSDRISATGRAMLATVRARLLAQLGLHSEAVAEVDRADGYFVDRDPNEDPPWLTYYDDAEHQGSTACALTPLAVMERAPEHAAARLEAAVRLHSDDYPRSRTFSRIRLATLLMDAGEPSAAVPIGRQALTDAVEFHSKRMADELDGLYGAAKRRTSVPEVADLAADLHQHLYGAEIIEP